MKKLGVILSFFIVLILAGITIFWFTVRDSNSSKSRHENFPSTIAGQLNFNLYYFKGQIPGEFILNRETVHYQNGVLVLEMKNKVGKKLVITEQRTPENYDITSLKGDIEFATSSGQAFVTDGLTRTTGTLFTKNQTWVLLNAPEPIGGETMKKIIESLIPTT